MVKKLYIATISCKDNSVGGCLNFVQIVLFSSASLHHDSQNEYIELLGAAVHKSILKDINDALLITINYNAAT